MGNLLLGFSKSKLTAKSQFLTFTKPGKDKVSKILYPFSEHTFTHSGFNTAQADLGDNYAGFITSYEPAIMGAMAPSAGLGMYAGSRNTLNGTHDWPRRTAASSEKADYILDYGGAVGDFYFTFYFSKETVIDAFYFQTLSLGSLSSLNTITIKENSTDLIYSSYWTNNVSNNNPYRYMWEKISLPNLTFKANIPYRITLNLQYNNFFRNPFGTDSSVTGTSVSLADGLVITCTDNGLAINVPSAWGFSIPKFVASGLSWLNNPKNFSVPYSGYQLWTVPKTGLYRITACGAAGGGGPASVAAPSRVTGEFFLTINSKLWICCGGRGRDGNDINSATYELEGAGSGGASWVVLADPLNPTDNTSTATIPLLIAAGSNGAASGYWYQLNPTLFATKSASSVQGTIDVGFSSATFSNWNATAGIQQFRGSGGGLNFSRNSAVGGYYITGGFGGGSGLLARYGNPGGGYELDTTGGYGTTSTPLVASKSYISPTAKNTVREDSIKQQFGTVSIKFLY